MKLESTLDNAAVFTLIPDGTANGRVCEVDDKARDSSGNVILTNGEPTIKLSQGGAPMSIQTWEIYEGEHIGKKIKFDNMMLGGLTKEGKPMPLGQYCAFLHYTGVPWTCIDCGTRYSDRHAFLIATKQDKERNGNLKVGSFYCKNCEAALPKISADTDDFLGARCGISIGHKKQQNSEREFNEVRGYTDLI